MCGRHTPSPKSVSSILHKGVDHKKKRTYQFFCFLSSHTNCIIFGRGCELGEDLIGE